MQGKVQRLHPPPLGGPGCELTQGGVQNLEVQGFGFRVYGLGREGSGLRTAEAPVAHPSSYAGARGWIFKNKSLRVPVTVHNYSLMKTKRGPWRPS